jgi:hypothetical protein
VNVKRGRHSEDSETNRFLAIAMIDSFTVSCILGGKRHIAPAT